MPKDRLLWNREDIFAFLEREFPQSMRNGRGYAINDLDVGVISVTKTISDDNLRPGGTISGPAMMEHVDIVAYMLLLAHHGERARLSVTTGMQISFLNKPKPGNIVCEGRFLKHGRTLSVIDCRLTSEGSQQLIAHAEATYYMNDAFAVK